MANKKTIEGEVFRGELFWGNLRKANDMSGKLQFDLCNMDDNTVKLLKENGVSIKNKGDERGDFTTVKGSPQYPPKVMDSKRNLLPEPVQLGNGTKVKIPAKLYEWEFKGKSGWSVSLDSIMVTKLVEFAGGAGALDEEEDGYVAAAPADGLAPEADEEEPF